MTPVDEELLERTQAVAKAWGKAHGAENLWGFGTVATAGGACLYDYDNSSTGPWNQYLCVRGDGGLDVGLGAQVFREWDDVKCFFLSAAVGRLWSALAVHAELSAKGFGPCEVTLALVDTEGSVLGGLAEGWAEPFAGFRHEARRCPEPNVLLRIELGKWPVAEDARELAFTLGALIENAWGYAIRRFIARTGPFEGKFDWRAATR